MDVISEGRGRLDGLAQLQAMIDSGRGPPIASTLQFHLAQIERGRAVFRATPGPHAYNPIGVVHGGYAATLLDSACGCAAHTRLTRAFTGRPLVVSVSKGLDPEGLTTPCGVLREVLPAKTPLAALSGPSFAEEVYQRQPTAVVAAAEDHEVAQQVQQTFSTAVFRVYSLTEYPAARVVFGVPASTLGF